MTRIEIRRLPNGQYGATVRVASHDTEFGATRADLKTELCAGLGNHDAERRATLARHDTEFGATRADLETELCAGLGDHDAERRATLVPRQSSIDGLFSVVSPIGRGWRHLPAHPFQSPIAG